MVSRVDSLGCVAQRPTKEFLSIERRDRLVARSVDLRCSAAGQLSLVRFSFSLLPRPFIAAGRFVCGPMLFVFTLAAVEQNHRLVTAENRCIESFLQKKHFTLLLGSERRLPVAQLLDELQRSQWYFTAQ